MFNDLTISTFNEIDIIFTIIAVISWIIGMFSEKHENVQFLAWITATMSIVFITCWIVFTPDKLVMDENEALYLEKKISEVQAECDTATVHKASCEVKLAELKDNYKETINRIKKVGEECKSK